MVAGLHSATTWFAIARASEWETCFTKVRLFSGRTSKSGSQLTGGTIKVIVTSEDGSGMVSGMRVDTDRNDDNGYCISHPCDDVEHFNLSAVVSYEGHLLNITDTNNSVINNVIINPDTFSNGVTYSSDQNCSEADIETDQYLAFRQQTCEMDVDVITQPLSYNTDQCHPEFYQAWHSAEEQTSRSFKSCHIKVVAPSSEGLSFKAISTSTVDISSAFNPGSLYGIREDCVTPEGVVCLQIKSGGDINCNNNPDNKLNDVTNVTVFAEDQSVTLSEIDSTLEKQFRVGSNLGNSTFQFSFTGDPYGIYYGIFCAMDSSPEAARWRSKRYCLSGKERDTEIDLNEVNQNRFAAKFE